jgi:predicted metal-binding membrane protein
MSTAARREKVSNRMRCASTRLTIKCATRCARVLVLPVPAPAITSSGFASMAEPYIEFAFVFAMWAVMMVGMMAPSAAPMILMYARVGRQAAAKGTPFAPTGWFAGGYFLAWIGFSLVATVAQWALERTALLDAEMASASSVLGGAILIAAGVYQWTPLKDVCLTQCQTPLLFLMRHGGFRQDASGCLLLGLRHGTYCIGCCWVLMALLFVGGVMNVLCIALLALLILLEKLFPFGGWIARASSIAFLAAGVRLLFLDMV